MGWFAVAAILGALLWGLWQLNRPYTVEGQALIVVWSIVALIVGLILFAALFQQSLRPAWIVDAIGHGRVARFLLGLAAGYVAAFALHSGLITGLNFLGIVAAITILALAAPHLDRWLPHMTGIKTAVIELQFASNATHKVAVAEKIEAFASEGALLFLSEYGDKIESDIRFVELIELPELQKKRGFTSKQDDYQEHLEFLREAKALKTVFKELISKLADCYPKAAGSSQHLQAILRPLARDIQQLVHNKDNPEFRDNAQETVHKRFWEGLLRSAADLDNSRVTWDIKCTSFVDEYQKTYPDISAERRAYPRISEFGRLPYLYTGAATFLMAAGELDAALKLLEYAEQEIRKQHANSKVGAHTDYGFLIRLAQARYYQGRPAADIGELFEKMRQTAVARQDKLRQHCGLVGCNETTKIAVKEMVRRHRAAEIMAMNEFVYNLSEDIARGIESASPFEAKMERYANLLKSILDSDELRSVGLDGEQHNFLDTYAYARIVLEARKSSPDIGVFKQMRRVLQDVVTKFEEIAREKSSREALQGLNAARIHYHSAQELSGR